ncbi:MAG: ABC transporter substrate-binding protein [Steroidobacteraceae bacterium]
MATASEEQYTRRVRDPFKIGVCMEFAGGTQIIKDFYDAIRLVCDEYTERGELDRPVDLIIREVKGPMRGTNPVVIEAWRELALQEKCLAIIGPEVTEANLALVEEVNRVGVPTISFCATLDWAGPYCYALQNGCFPDEANLLAGYLAKQGLKKVGVFREDGIIGTEYFTAFRTAARRYGLSIVSDQIVGLFNTQQPVEPQLAAVRSSGAQCIVVFSAYGALPPVQQAISRSRRVPLRLAAGGDARAGSVSESDDLPCFQNTTWVMITAFGAAGDWDKAALLREFEGWTGIDQIHEGNQTFQRMLDKFERRYGRRPFHCYTALGFDHGMVIADSLSRMKPPSPLGFKKALERLRMREACIGAPGTVISFGAHDNRGYKGEYVVLRTIRNGIEQIVNTRLRDVLQTQPLQVGSERGDTAKHASMGGKSKYALVGDRTPFRVGVIQDFALFAPVKLWYQGLQLAFEEAYENGVVDRPIEIVLREVEGPPDRSAAPVVDAYRELVHKEHVLAVVGPFITDMTRILQPVVEAECVPTLSYCATLMFDGDYCFQTPNGTFADETYLIVRHLVKAGVKSVGVVREDNPIGDEYYDYFRQHARRLGLAIASDQIVSPRVTPEQMTDALEAIRAADAQSVAHLGYGLAFFEAVRGMHTMVKRGWDVPRVTITTWVMFSGMDEECGSPKLLAIDVDRGLLEGWVGVDLLHEGNAVFQAFLDRYVKRFGGPRPFNCYPAHMYDIGRVLAEGISHARPVTPKGLKRGLEQVRMLPATMGAPGTVMSLAPYDHRAYKSPDYLVLRTVKNGKERLVD